MDPVEFRKKHASSLDDIKLHWRVENGELINDGMDSTSQQIKIMMILNYG